MARWGAETWQDVTNFDGCGFGKYCFISLRLALLMPLKPSHNLLVRGSNPCGGTKYLVSVLTLGFVSSSLQAPQTHQSTYVSETKVAR